MSRAPWSAIPAARSTAPVLKIRLALVLGALLLSAAMGIVSTMAWISHAKSQGNSTAPAEAAGLAQIVADDYVAGVAPPASLVNPPNRQAPNFTTANWRSLSASPAIPAPIDYSFQSNGTGATAQIFEVHRYLVTTTSGSAFDLTVTLDVTNPAHPFLYDTPTQSAATN